jgi:SAP domain
MESVNTYALSKRIAKQFKLKSKDVLSCIKEFVENSSDEGIVIVTDYSARSAALFGNTKSVWDDLKELNGEKKKVVTFNSKLAFGPGIVVTGKYLKEVKEVLDEKEIEYEEKERDQYEKEFKGESPEKESKTTSKTKAAKTTSKTKATDYKKMTIKLLKEELMKRGLKTTGKKDELMERLEKSDSGSTEKKSTEKKKGTTPKKAKEPAKGKKMPASKSAPKLKAKQNEWGNFEDEETGIVFLKLPVGKDGRDMSVAIGVQNTEVDGQGLETVLPIDDDVIEECKTQKFKMFNESMLKTLKKNDREKYDEIQAWLESTKEDEDEDGEEEEEDGEEE